MCMFKDLGLIEKFPVTSNVLCPFLILKKRIGHQSHSGPRISLSLWLSDLYIDTLAGLIINTWGKSGC